MRCALVQFSPHLGLIEKNLALHYQYIEQARKEKADLIIFPELSLTGYTLKDLTAEVALNPYQDQRLNQLKTLSHKIDIIVGLVEEKEKGLFYNSAVYYSQGEILAIHRKVFLPTFGLFEEGKFFATGRFFRCFSTSFGRIGLLICRDFLHYGASYCLLAGKSDLIIVISAAPGRGMSEKPGFASSEMWELMAQTISRFSTAFVIYCNRVGFEDGVVFAGGSFIYDPWGKCLLRGPDIDPAFLIQELDLENLRLARKTWSFLRDDKPEIILNSLQNLLAKNEN
ncbi:MAG: nitrilase [Candidatus Aminicenantes bacterium]|nr:nitrilase [Candidatus Aminicenantes bacterium]